MGILRFAKFLPDFVMATGHFVREHYYLIALRHIGPNHPESWLVTNRMLASRSRVNDFLTRWTT